jgi:hypothetical protein
MYKVEWKDALGMECEEDVISLDRAMLRSKEINAFVTITGNGMEIVGRFGVDAVKDGLCPDGVQYDWNKASRIGATRRR